MMQVFGDFREELPKSNQFLLISFAPSLIPLQQRWRNNGLSADFVADYLVTFFPISENDPSTIQRQLELKSAVSYIANELLENAMKFHDESTEQPIQFGIHLLEHPKMCVFCASLQTISIKFGLEWKDTIVVMDTASESICPNIAMQLNTLVCKERPAEYEDFGSGVLEARNIGVLLVKILFVDYLPGFLMNLFIFISNHKANTMRAGLRRSSNRICVARNGRT